MGCTFLQLFDLAEVVGFLQFGCYNLPSTLADETCAMKAATASW